MLIIVRSHQNNTNITYKSNIDKQFKPKPKTIRIQFLKRYQKWHNRKGIKQQHRYKEIPPHFEPRFRVEHESVNHFFLVVDTDEALLFSKYVSDVPTYAVIFVVEVR